MKNAFFGAATSVAVMLLAVTAAWAGEAQEQTLSLADGTVVFSGGGGLLGLQADEYVYLAPGSSNTVSHLIWQSVSPMLTGAMDVKLPEGWTFSANADVAGLGRGYMEDYDWFGPNFISFDPNLWTHRSQSPNTGLDWYFKGSILVGRDLAIDNKTKVNINGGLQYTDARWTAAGGTFIYSDIDVGDGCGFRGCTGTFADTPGITYHQQLPALVAGADFSTETGDWTWGGSAHAGLIFGAHTTDNHWLRELNIFDGLGAAPLLSVSANADYKLSKKTSFVLSGSVQKIFTARADAYYDYHDGVTDSFDAPDRNGSSLLSASLSASFKGSF